MPPIQTKEQRDAAFRDAGVISADSLQQQEAVDFQGTPEDIPVATPDFGLTGTEQEVQTEIEGIAEQNKRLLGESADQTSQEDLAGVSGATSTITDLEARAKNLIREELSIPLQLQQESEGRGRTAGGVAPLQAGRLRENAIQALTVGSLLETARGNLTNAQALADKAVAAKYDPIKEDIRVRSANLELIMASPQFSLEQKNRAQKQLDFQNAEIARVAKAEADDKAKWTLATDAMKSGADMNTVKLIQEASTAEEALRIFASSNLIGGEADEMQFIAGTANQPSGVFNKTTGVFTPGATLEGGVGSEEAIQKANSQLDFLNNTATSALALADASGAAGITKFFGDKFIGDSKFRRLEALTNTLRTNVLTLMTDPSIKKFFGPQMSEADVRLMTAAGSTLNPENQSPSDLSTEIKRLQKLFVKMKTAVDEGVGTGEDNIITAPDGTQVIITN